MNIDIDYGYKKLTINNDENNFILFNASDVSIVKRMEDGVKKIEKLANDFHNVDLLADGTPSVQTKENFEIVEKIDNAIREEIDSILDSKASDVLFGKKSTLAMVGGIQLWERVLIAIIPVVKNEVLKQNKIRRNKLDKYVKQARK